MPTKPDAVTSRIPILAYHRLVATRRVFANQAYEVAPAA